MEESISFSDLKNGILGNFYDIYHKQDIYFDLESRVRLYEKKNLTYIRGVKNLFSNHDDCQASLHYDDQNDSVCKQTLEEKWYHFVSTTFLKQMVTLCHANIITKYFSIPSSFLTNNGKDFFVIFFDFHQSNAKLIHFLLQEKLSVIHDKMYAICNPSTMTLQFVDNVYSIDYIKELRTKINYVKSNFMKVWYQNPELYPQFFHSGVLCNQQKYNDGEKVGEISLLYQCGKKIRTKCHEKRIVSFYHKDFLDQLSCKLRPIIERILFVNSVKSSSWKAIDPSMYEDEDYQRCKTCYHENKILYIDLEFTKKQIYLCGFSDNHEQFEYIWETKSNLEFMNQFISFIENHPDFVFIYYSAEKKKIQEYIRKLHLAVRPNFFESFVDLYILLSKYTAFRHCYDFKLKNITKAFQAQNLITQGYQDAECQSGTESIDIFEDYVLFKRETDKNKIIDYNRLDCIHQKKIFEALL